MISNKTLELYKCVLKQPLLNKNEIVENKDKLVEYFNQMTAKSQRIAIPAFRYFKNEFNINEDDIANLRKHFKVHTNKKEFHYMTKDHINKLKIYLSSCTLKEKLILTILFELGIRRFEVQKVVKGYLKSRNSDFQIITKKNSVRKIYLTNEVEALLRQALIDYDETTILKWTSDSIVYRTTKKCFSYIGYNGACHDFRRHFAQNLDEKGERLSVIKSLMGHSNIATTSIYIRQNDNELKKVIQNQHKVKEAIDVKQHIALTNRVDELVNDANKKDEFINHLLKQIESLTKENSLIVNRYNDLLDHFNRLKNKNKYIKENKRVEALIKRKMNKYETEAIKNLLHSL